MCDSSGGRGLSEMGDRGFLGRGWPGSVAPQVYANDVRGITALSQVESLLWEEKSRFLKVLIRKDHTGRTEKSRWPCEQDTSWTVA